MSGAVIENLSTRKLCFMVASLLAAAIVFFLIGGLICECFFCKIVSNSHEFIFYSAGAFVVDEFFDD